MKVIDSIRRWGRTRCNDWLDEFEYVKDETVKVQSLCANNEGMTERLMTKQSAMKAQA